MPDITHRVFAEPLGPLSRAETRKLCYRLPALTDQIPEPLGLILRHIGGHPRLLEYLDAILRKGVARLPAVAERLRQNARRLGLDPEALGGDLEAALRDALRLGAKISCWSNWSPWWAASPRIWSSSTRPPPLPCR